MPFEPIHDSDDVMDLLRKQIAMQCVLLERVAKIECVLAALASNTVPEEKQSLASSLAHAQIPDIIEQIWNDVDETYQDLLGK